MKKLVAAIAFAADKHRNQRRKDEEASPYINHPIALADVLANEAGVEDERVIVAAVLHDTVEDTETTEQELLRLFGKDVADIVMEVTDDKSLPKEERKRLQVEHAATISRRAKLVKLADKICNLRDIARHPPRTGRSSASRRISTGRSRSSIRCAVCIPVSRRSSTPPTTHGRPTEAPACDPLEPSNPPRGNRQPWRVSMWVAKRSSAIS